MPKRRHQDQQAEPEEPEASDEAFGTKRYWDSHYAKYATQQAADDTDEWYLAYTGGLDEILSGAMSRGRDSAVLDIGCGTSRMLRDMRESGHVGELVGCDFSGVELARRCNAGLDIAIKEADCRSCAAVLGRDAFDLILDKGTVDALLCDEDEGEENVRRECGQVREMLRVGGTFCLVTPKYPEEEEEDEGAFEAGDVDGFAGWLQAAIAGLSGRATLHEAGGAGSAAPEGYRCAYTRTLHPQAGSEAF